MIPTVAGIEKATGGAMDIHMVAAWASAVLNIV